MGVGGFLSVGSTEEGRMQGARPVRQGARKEEAAYSHTPAQS